MTIGPSPKIASLRAQELDPGRIVRHIRQVEADFAEAIEEHLRGDDPPQPGTDERMRITVTARCIAAAVFGAMEVWMLGEDRSLPELARLCRDALESLRKGIDDARTREDEVSSILTKLGAACQPQPMTDFDAIVVGAGHNGLTAAALLQQAGLRTLCLDSKLYAGGMASTVELFDGYKFEIAGSVQIPTSAAVSRELGLDDLPTVDLDVMSVSLRGVGDEPLVYYTDPMKLLTHLNEVHGAEAVNGMAGLMAWCQAPTRALGRFDAGQPPKTLDEMYACATNEFERSTITDLLFGSVTDVLDRYLPDKEKHGALRGHAVAPGRQHHLPRARDAGHRRRAGLRVRRARRERAAGQEVARRHRGADLAPVQTCSPPHGGELRLRSKVEEILVADGRRQRRPPRGRLDARPRRSSSPRSPRTSPSTAWSTPAAVPADVRERFSRIDHRGSYLQMHFALDGVPEFAAPYEVLNDPAMQSEHRHLQHTRGTAAAVGGLPARHRARRPGHRAADPVGQRPRPGAAGQARGVGVLALVPGRGEPSRATAR